MSEDAPSVNWPILLVGLALIGGLVVVLATGFGKDPKMVSNALPGKPAPSFSLATLEGDPVSLSDLAGTPTVLNFWSTWCQPCKAEHPHLVAAAQAYKGRGVAFLGVLYNDEPIAARRFLAQNGFGFPTLYDPTQRVVVDYGVTGVPETFIIDATGTVVFKKPGPVVEGELESILEGML
ncbi:MAG: cytochrome c biogenesis protein CcmG/thiol:disulfide interchange protein DsbE [Myxococcota bacterium]|jgi:cytochrome c biogenesis protein CcmG/thiol:disulfide interchange protein DsbE